MLTARMAGITLALIGIISVEGDPGDPVLPAGKADQSPELFADGITAVLTPRHETVLSSEVAGQVVSVNREFGQTFLAGELLVAIDDTRYVVNHQMAQSVADAAEQKLARTRALADRRTRQRRAEAMLAAATANLTATQQLYEDKQASLIDLENARRDAAVAQTNSELVDTTSAEELAEARRERAVATGRLAIARQQVEACAITAPWEGRIRRTLVREHQWIQPGTPVVEIIDDHVLVAKFLLPSHVVPVVTIGQKLHLTTHETSTEVSMTISHIAAELDPASVTFEVHAEIDNGDGKLRAGMNGMLRLSEIVGLQK